MNVIVTYFVTETATATDTERWKSGISRELVDGAATLGFPAGVVGKLRRVSSKRLAGDATALHR